jgi:hypothetical protein
VLHCESSVSHCARREWLEPISKFPTAVDPIFLTRVADKQTLTPTSFTPLGKKVDPRKADGKWRMGFPPKRPQLGYVE